MNSRKQNAHAHGDYCKGFVSKISLTGVCEVGSINLHRWKSLGDRARYNVVCVHIAEKEQNESQACKSSIHCIAQANRGSYKTRRRGLRSRESSRHVVAFIGA